MINNDCVTIRVTSYKWILFPNCRWSINVNGLLPETIRSCVICSGAFLSLHLQRVRVKSLVLLTVMHILQTRGQNKASESQMTFTKTSHFSQDTFSLREESMTTAKIGLNWREVLQILYNIFLDSFCARSNHMAALTWSYFRFRLLLAPGQGQSDIASPPAPEPTLGTNPVISFHMFAEKTRRWKYVV